MDEASLTDSGMAFQMTGDALETAPRCRIQKCNTYTAYTNSISIILIARQTEENIQYVRSQNVSFWLTKLHNKQHASTPRLVSLLENLDISRVLQ